jgi:hypothetical protein
MSKYEKQLESKIAEIKDDNSFHGDSIWFGTLSIRSFETRLIINVNGNSKLAAISKAFRKSKKHPFRSYEYSGEALSIVLEQNEEDILEIVGLYSIAMLGPQLIGIISSNDMKMLKGLAYSCLCFALNILEKKKKLPAKLELTAEGKIVGKSDMRGLVEYYKTMGFHVSDSQNFENDLNDGSVPMKADSSIILQNCSIKAKHKADEIGKIITIHEDEEDEEDE